ncbi:cell surface glycoprotein CD200 receptor 1-like isoform X2 [Hippopotamus amphibius kiboko]|uniref:cell surface glycoprotein CD200 receptor 1-like isoform X2 n=1 Tax=Hippopotamus amphibius kiboko TaxID=575201 RepID=UPI002596322E|nr:cell surface glycoprotein CD200 receptor 1-like isoform X2 [Hippopotamus amphibius kiboko]
MQMFEKTSAERLLISIIMMSASTITSSSMDRHQRTITSPQEVNTSLLVLVDTKAMLSCPAVPWTSVLLATWEIVLRDKPPCLRAFRSDTNETTGGNCTDKRITWASGLDKNPALHIDPVAITHDGYYRCQIVIPAGNFHHGYHLQVLVPPEVTLVQTENGTAVCKAFAGKPAAQISWTPEGDCVTEQEPYWGNDTVTIQSTCRWDDRHVPNVSCSVSHLTGNRSLSIKLNQGARTLGFPASGLLIILYVKFSLLLVTLVIVGFVYFQRTNDCRQRHWRDDWKSSSQRKSQVTLRMEATH